MEFIETQTFTRLITSLLPDDDYHLLQTELMEDDQIYMLLAYPKSKKDTLSDEETKILRDLVKEL